MKNRKMKRIIVLALLSVLLFSCSSKEKHRNVDDSQTEGIQNNIDAENTQLFGAQSIKFDTLKMITKLNIFIPTITNLPSTFSCKIDSVNRDPITKSIINILHYQDVNVISYKFNCDAYFKNLMVVVATHSDSTVIKKAFSELKKTVVDGSSCLSKTNDYYFRTNYNIFWLHGSCYYPYHNFQKIKNIFSSSLTNASFNDSIKCKCGDHNITKWK